MRFRTKTWALLSLALFVAAAFFWQLGQERRATEHPPKTEKPVAPARSVSQTPVQAPIIFPANMIATAPAAVVSNSITKDKSSPKNPFRLSNTTASASELARNP